MYRIYPIPHKIHGPPYLELLYAETRGISENRSEFVVEPFSWKKLLFSRIKKGEHQVVHIHWPTNIYGSAYILVSIFRMLYRFSGLWILKFSGTRIIWTMHNMHGHDYPHPRIDDLGQLIMWHTANRVIVQEKTFAASETARRRSKKIVCIPPGNYINAYGSLWTGDKEELLKRYGIKKDGIVILAIGSVRPYKALPPIIESVIKANALGAKIHLIIAGKASPEYAKVITAKVGENKSITLLFEYIADEKIPEFLALADYTICYYSETTLGSAAVMLSLSYGVPVITRDFPASELVIQGKGGFIFHDDEELLNILLSLYSAPKFDKNVVIETIIMQDWKNTGKKLRKLCEELWNKAV